ncbi:MAG: alpha/beta hydrolase family protein [Akkermansiaceae bacterium]
MMIKRLLYLTILFTSGSSTLEAKEPSDTNYDERKVPDYELPDPLVGQEGRPVGLGEWESHRRAEILRLFEESVYGTTPRRKLSVSYKVVENDRNAFDGLATRKQVAAFFGDRNYRLDILLYIPNKPATPVPAFAGLNFKGNHAVQSDSEIIRQMRRNSARERGASASRWPVRMLVESGYALATIHRDQVDPDNYRNDFSDGIHPLFYDEGQKKPGPEEWGSIGAWAWSLSRILDYLETDERIDAKRVAVMGHSRLGKTALWAGAQDNRFAMVISNNSGSGGAALYRRCYGERIHHILKPVPYWFCTNHRKYSKREHELPVDQHMLLALMAPRPVYVASATEDRWADPKGEFLAAKHASPVYALYGKSGLSGLDMPEPDNPIHTTIGYHLRTGKHGVTTYDWQQYINFADGFLKSD